MGGWTSAPPDLLSPFAASCLLQPLRRRLPGMSCPDAWLHTLHWSRVLLSPTGTMSSPPPKSASLSPALLCWFQKSCPHDRELSRALILGASFLLFLCETADGSGAPWDDKSEASLASSGAGFFPWGAGQLQPGDALDPGWPQFPLLPCLVLV